MSVREKWFRLMRKIPVLGNKKYFLASAVYLTPRKIANILLCEYERSRRVLYPKSKPYIVILDVANVCNLRCPYCPTGARQSSGRKPAMMTADFVSHLMDHLADTTVIAYLYNWGEPLLNPQIVEIIQEIHRRGIFTSMSTNLSVHLDSRLEALSEAGLDHIDPSIDGASQDVYELYRKRGNIDLVFDNLTRLIAHRLSAKRVNPVIEWQYLRFSHNLHEESLAMKKAKELGVDRFISKRGRVPQSSKEIGQIDQHINSQDNCSLLWRSVVVNADGGIAPCCYMYNAQNDFGNLADAPLEDIRQNGRFVMGRRLFDPRLQNEVPADIMHPCLQCHVAAAQPHLKSHVLRNSQPGGMDEDVLTSDAIDFIYPL